MTSSNALSPLALQVSQYYTAGGWERIANLVRESQGSQLREAAEEALGVLVACCVPAGGCDDQAAIQHAQDMLVAALRPA